MLGAHPRPKDLERLASDLRTFDTNGIERAAWGWDQHEARGLDAYHRAEKAALAFIERSDLGPAWEDFRRTLFGLTESLRAAWHQQGRARGARRADGRSAALAPSGPRTRSAGLTLAGPIAARISKSASILGSASTSASACAACPRSSNCNAVRGSRPMPRRRTLSLR